ncbi:uncharacterized protein DNG_09599 [Cephalotrichum gorgonifer]|uniref:Azaphilone pigments biosynthesis cluster protein L N-terminal domain-containing protein n=1 Tax=Cephalotrichum gorgonifer TaxID=2041049 RepID=A0AAE8N608_9PEZI|nr:uncharacterized protein DNG_09599 [Cephalotrichum gorgonifer]
MADPLSISASVLTVVITAVQSARSLTETVKRFKDRDKTLRRLDDELKDLISILTKLEEAQTSKLSQQVLEKYNDLIQDTAYSLTVLLQHLNDEWAVTQQCLRICEDAMSYIETLTAREPSLQSETTSENDTDGRPPFEAQRLTIEMLDEQRDKCAEVIGHLRARLESAALDETSRGDDEKARLQGEIDNYRKCLEVCKVAAKEVSRRKIHTVGEVIADGSSDQVVVTTWADLFDVKKATSKDNSAQLIGSMSEDALRQLSTDRYNSRFGALNASVDVATSETTLEPHRTGNSGLSRQASNDAELRDTVTRRKPAPNEVRKRSVDR